jgi:hypothetical protein
MSGTASGQIVAVSTGPNTYQYDIILDDTGSTAIGTLWFAWNASPDYNLMTISPSAVLAPSGWTGIVTNNGTGDGYGIQWTANTATSALIAGSTLSGFQFSGTLPPATLFATSPIGTATLPMTNTFVYTGGPFSSTPYSFSMSGAATPSSVTTTFENVERTGPTTAQVDSAINQIDTGQETLSQYAGNLIQSEQTLYSALPALVTIDAYYNATPSSTTLNTVAAATGAPSQIGGFYSATYLHNLGYSDPNVWTIMASQWGADPTSPFYQEYSSFGTNYSGFISAVYQREFGFAPSATNLQNLINDVPGVQALLGGGGSGPTPIQVVSGIYGYLLYVGQTTPTITTTQYTASADAFLQAAAAGTVNYGEELTKQFPPGTTGSTSGGAMAADPNVITVTSSDQLIDPGAGSFSIQFQSGTAGDTLMLHNGGVDQVSGFDPSTDVLDVHALLAGTGLALSGDVASLSGFLNVTDQGGNALVSFDPTGHGGGGTVAVLQGLGDGVTGLASLIAKGAVRMS